jgi:hypothetical protein
MARHLRPSWDLALATTFVIGSGWMLFPSLVYPGLIGSHAVLYTAAAQTILTGADPWSVGPPATIFAGPPTMPLTFIGFVSAPDIVIRVSWIAIDVLVAVWAIRRLGLPSYWIAFPPLLQTIVLGHPELLVLGLLVAGGNVSGLAIIVKPYAVFPLLAERRWGALALAVAVVLVTAPFLPWGRFFEELPTIIGTIVRQNNGDSTFGDPIPLSIAVVALLSLGLRRALWLAVPVIWPYAQPNYKVMTVPALAPVLAIAWAIPIPGMTFTGVVVLAVLVTINRLRPLPDWLQRGIREFQADRPVAEHPAAVTPSLPPAAPAGAA